MAQSERTNHRGQIKINYIVPPFHKLKLGRYLTQSSTAEGSRINGKALDTR
jgi:hypothetical protein